MLTSPRDHAVAGDLSAEKFSLGYGPSILIFGAMIAAVAFAHYAFRRTPCSPSGWPTSDPAAGRLDR
jgi:uncharacterized membrane-anchored protein